MRALILAAGIGQRLADAANNQPKCLLEFAGKSLLLRHLEILQYYGIASITIVTGYEREKLTKAIKASGISNHLQTVNNPEYHKGSHISLLTGLSYMATEGDFILMDADVLYDHRMIDRLLNTAHANCFLLDKHFIPGEEPVKLCVADNRIIEFRKQVSPDLEYDLQGESVGFFRFTSETAKRLIKACNDYLDQGEQQTPYEECIRDLLLETPQEFGYEDVSDLGWVEIDFPEDITRAEQEILPKIEQIN